MFQFKILSGKKAGATCVARRFPVLVGRSAQCDVRFEEPGVWDKHFQVTLNPAAGFVLETQPDALVTANGQPVQRTALRNGDTIEIGELKVQFWVGEAQQRGLRASECIVWTTVAAVLVGQVALVYWLL
jgi:pSer/pThr/pTyr-binding forkhead associated (FHA) protein